MHVLIIGYGKIGRIKANIWTTLGAKVCVYDKNKHLDSDILRNGYELHNARRTKFDVVDISTPAGSHYDAMVWAIKQTDSNVYLIEKPLASTKKELDSFKKLLAKRVDLENKVFVNESYYQSELLKEVISDINARKSKILNIHIELSKNRLRDHEEGRFFDNHLESIGIEVPHMLAILNMFNIHLPDTVRPTLTVDSVMRVNQAFQLKVDNINLSVSLESHIGDFRLNDTNTTRNISTKRVMIIETDELDYKVEFDPLSSHDRFYGKITLINNRDLIMEKLVLDNHLKNQLTLFMGEDFIKHKDTIGIRSALKICQSLLKMREMCEIDVLDLPSDESAKAIYNEKEKVNGV